MTHINEKLGLKAAGAKQIMARVKQRGADGRLLTRLACPQCGHRWVLYNKIHGDWRHMCGWCAYAGVFE